MILIAVNGGRVIYSLRLVTITSILSDIVPRKPMLALVTSVGAES